MITNNFKQFMKLILVCSHSSSSAALNLPVVAPDNSIKYLSQLIYNSFPGSVGYNVCIRSNYSSEGIYLGRGTTQPTEDDYCLEQLITSGLSPSATVTKTGMDSNGNPYIEFTFMLTNTTSADIIVSEIGYVQEIYAENSIGETPSVNSTETFLFDRTLLDTPVTVPANDSAVIKYTLKTIVT